jgi:hypothetical protein
MFGAKSGLRVTAAVTIAALALATPLSAAQAASETYPSTVNFLTSKFVDGKALDGFTPGTPDYGFTLEAMLQRKAAGQKLSDKLFVPAKAVLADNLTLAKSIVATYAYDSDKKVKPGVAGKFLFTSVAIGAPNAPLRNAVVADLKKAIAASGSIPTSAGNTFDYAWAILGLATNNQTKLANTVATNLTSLQRPDGGFGMDQTGDTLASSADATGIAIQALALAKRSATKSQAAAQQKSIVAAALYLRTTQVTGNHWDAWGDADVNGTAYAAMGLKAAGANITAIQAWLKTRIAPSGGLTTPWSNGTGDVFATAQGYVPLIGLSYLNLIPVKK